MKEWFVTGIETGRVGFSPRERAEVGFFTIASTREEAISIRVGMEDRLFDRDFIPYGATEVIE